MNIDKTNTMLDGSGIKVTGFRNHTKASEKYVDVTIFFSNDHVWEGSVPFYYRRTGLFLYDEDQLVKYLNRVKELFDKNSINNFVQQERKRWNEEMSEMKVTAEFFDALLNMKWTSADDLPTNTNPQRRMQTIKEMGYTIATYLNMPTTSEKRGKNHYLLLPIPKGFATGYEVMSKTFKKRAILALDRINAFELSSANHQGLIPDHKFPEIRWDKKTREENESLTDEEIKKKFQLLDNQRNQQKREVCRKCYQENKRGIIFGVNYFYAGNGEWPNHVSASGKEAEEGCVGCAWYDIQKWRSHLNDLLENQREK